MQALDSPLSAVVLNGGFASGGIWQCLETFLMAWLGVGGPGAPGQNAATHPTVMAPQQRITQPQVSVQDEKACLKGPAVVACGVCTGSLGGRAVLHVIQLDI